MNRGCPSLAAAVKVAKKAQEVGRGQAAPRFHHHSPPPTAFSRLSQQAPATPAAPCFAHTHTPSL